MEESKFYMLYERKTSTYIGTGNKTPITVDIPVSCWRNEEEHIERMLEVQSGMMEVKRKRTETSITEYN